MKKIILVALFAGLAAYQTNAQRIPGRRGEPKENQGPHQKQHYGALLKDLNLTETQKEQIKKENEAFRKKMQELKNNENITVKEWKMQREKLFKEHKENLQQVLTDEQKTKLEKIKADRKKEMEQRTEKRAEQIKKELGLTDAQAEAFRKNRQELAEKIKSVKENQSLSKEQKKEQIRELMQKHNEWLKSNLTPEQYEKLKEMRKDRFKKPKRSRPVGLIS
ncbi:MAG: hypothetical protein N2747_05150 [Chitinophagaceae bacterium]|nr:hypothetical protein [Chitinophagaceae bacterium]